MNWIFLSPHFDDAVYSCGGLIWLLASRQDIQAQPLVLTVCAGDPPPGPLSLFAQSLHQRWESGADAANRGWEAGIDAVNQRRQEDDLACARLGAQTLRYSLPDCIYRKLGKTDQPLIQVNEDLFMPLPEAELPLAAELVTRLDNDIPAGSSLVSPLALGGHIDHRLVRLAAETLAEQRSDLYLYYYADVPYVLESPGELQALHDAGWSGVMPGLPPTNQSQPGPDFAEATRSLETSSVRQVQHMTSIPEAASSHLIPGSPDAARNHELPDMPEAALEAWTSAMACYRSQVSTFWSSIQEMKAAMRAYAASSGVRLWQPG